MLQAEDNLIDFLLLIINPACLSKLSFQLKKNWSIFISLSIYQTHRKKDILADKKRKFPQSQIDSFKSFPIKKEPKIQDIQKKKPSIVRTSLPP